MSPTMTEGNIASWRVKEGENFSAGDVLLEIETDKAQMDVEAQEDGIMFKITQNDGSKGVKVGTRIAVLADAGDDLSSLSVPAEETSSTSAPAQPATPSPQEETKGGIDTSKSSESQAEAPPSSKAGAASASSSGTSTSESTPSSGKPQKQKYPLYPSVVFALKEHGLTKADADKIPATGPNGRLLKGDVLSYVGSIEKSYSSQQSARLTKLGHMDLSNIQLASPKAPIKASKEEVAAAPPLPEDTEIALPISLSAVIATQKRVQDTLGITLPLGVFITRASELANEDLPLARGAPSADDLFNSILGLDQVASSSSRGAYFPNVMGLPASSPSVQRRAKKADVFDELLGAKPKSRTQAALPPLVGKEGVATAMNVFSVTAKQGEEKRVQAYLERMKMVLESEPGRLVL
ncbi:putative pyruvate dehydrogenase complex protein X component [Elsinoe australis]|uniref:Putative pyruvate dehydrogenase complex protein X component n=1 Tax=Elsinoe australis TaxID=40998 RepID=A0A4U7BEE4_9PEZI|nr:putative pyruvate dehydrogenase complex protein X component [Elsinoe australis]